MFKLWEAVQYLHQVGLAELGSSTGGLDLLRQSNFFFFHRWLSVNVYYSSRLSKNLNVLVLPCWRLNGRGPAFWRALEISAALHLQSLP